MNKWLALSIDRRIEILNQSSVRSGMRAHAIEKDWWVTLSLKAIFSGLWSSHLVFKGGTSLTKSWKLIDRFSEDIDLAINKTFLGFEGEANKSKVERLRRNASNFISHDFRDGLEKAIIAEGILEEQFKLSVKFGNDSIRDPQVLELTYSSVLEPDPNPYLKEKVIIEVGARSLMEPSSQRETNSIISESFPDSTFAEASFMIQCVDPKRTFLEKIFLLHEIFVLEGDTKAHERMSRHLYDVEKMMDTHHATEALLDKRLYEEIIEHREAFNKVTGVNYELHQPGTIDFIPPDSVIKTWESDYRDLQSNMIYGDSLSFDKLMERLKRLRDRFRVIN